MNDIILFRALFFVAVILLAAVIMTVFALGSSLVTHIRTRHQPQMKAKSIRKWIPVVTPESDRENPFTAPASNSWFLLRLLPSRPIPWTISPLELPIKLGII